MIIKLIKHHAQRAASIGGKFRIVLRGTLRSDGFKDLNYIEQSQPFRTDGQPVSAADAPSSVNDSRASEVAQDLRQMVGGNPVFGSDFSA